MRDRLRSLLVAACLAGILVPGGLLAFDVLHPAPCPGVSLPRCP